MDPHPSPPFSDEAQTGEPRLLRALGPWGAMSLVIGIMIGSAIFIVPAQITGAVGSKNAAIAVWVISGILSLLGALSFAELAALMPDAGGQYVYLREAYGPLVGFLCGWIFFFVQESGGIATLAAGLAEFLAGFVPLTSWEQKIAGALVIIFLTGINYRGVRQGGWVQSVVTGLNVGLVVALILLAYILGHPPVAHAAAAAAPHGSGTFAAFGVAMISALWAYEGWNAVTFAAGEIKRPERNMPLALIGGTSVVIALYVGLNFVYYHVLTLGQIAGSPRVAADAAQTFLGSHGSQLISLAIIIAIFGSLNGSILSSARVYYAMAKDGIFFRSCARVHPRFHTPHVALLAQLVWSVVLVLAGGYEQLYTYVIFAGWIFYALTAFAVIVLRRKMPNKPRPYRVWAYPIVPIIFVLTAIWLVANTLIERPVEAGWGMGILALGVPVYYFWKRKASRAVDPGA
jgi:basic amino acid/polyamine antiporter, APA family